MKLDKKKIAKLLLVVIGALIIASVVTLFDVFFCVLVTYCLHKSIPFVLFIFFIVNLIYHYHDLLEKLEIKLNSMKPKEKETSQEA